jgi:hypothetical protein
MADPLRLRQALNRSTGDSRWAARHTHGAVMAALRQPACINVHRSPLGSWSAWLDSCNDLSLTGTGDTRAAAVADCRQRAIGAGMDSEDAHALRDVEVLL